jgi:formylglycine-generating enzyme required for sulfatase activity
VENLHSDGFEGTSPVDAFPANGYGVSDMIGNVWEWTTDWYQPAHPREPIKACCIPRIPAADRKRRATTRVSRRSGFPARC